MQQNPFLPSLPWPAVTLPVPVDPAGLAGPTPGQARGPRWRRVGYNAYVPSSAPPSPEQRIADAMAHVPDGGALTGWAALRVAGAAYFDGREHRASGQRLVPVAVGRSQGRRRNPGVVLRYERLDPSELLVLRGLPVVPPERALFDELRSQDRLRLAVIATDMALAARVTTIDAMTEYIEAHAGARRSARAKDALALASPDARSPEEVALRLICELDAGLAGLHVNVPVFDLRGREICLPDLLDEEAGLVIEYDGAAHRRAQRQHRDIVRAEACRRVGLEYCAVSSLDTRDTILDRLASTRARAQFLPAHRRAWTLVRPPGWRAPW